MRLKAIILEGFRAYRDRVQIPLGGVTAFIGKNDVGKSSILEALAIFFDSGEAKIEQADLCALGGTAMRIGAVFNDLPSEVVLDATAKTSLRDEHLLNSDGDLEIHKVYEGSMKSPKAQVCAVAFHPVGPVAGDLLLKKNSELKKLVKDLGIDVAEVNLTSNVELRRAIWNHCNPLELARVEVPVDKEDAKKVWEALRPYLPVYALFKSDRSSQDGDPEVQDPLRLAVSEAMRTLDAELRSVENAVTKHAKEVAERTLAKVKEMDPTLAAELTPEFKTEPKWDSIFRFALTCERGVPLNKRGSGVRRLVLLSFFRAEAERRQSTAKAPGIIYAIEEPETSQHPSNQRLIVEAMLDLAANDNAQVLLTTHVPALAGLLPTESLRYIRRSNDGKIEVAVSSDSVLERISRDLGVLPDAQVKVLVYVEGPNDVVFLRHMSRILRDGDPTLIDLTEDARVVLVPIGGSSLVQWVHLHYLGKLNRAEVHIFDRDLDVPPRYQKVVDEVNGRKGGPCCWATLTGKREIENYLHPAAIADALKVGVDFGPDDDVPLLAARALYEAHPGACAWEALDLKARERKVSSAKKRLCDEAAAKMSAARLAQSDENGEIARWLAKVKEYAAL